MFESDYFVGINVDFLKDAIVNGISAEAVASSLNSIADKSDELNKNPRQIYNVINTLAFMKKDTKHAVDTGYKSNTLKKNNNKILLLLHEGILPNEIFEALNEMINNSYNKRRGNVLKFITKLVVKMKERELRLAKRGRNDKSYQKVLTQ